MTRVRGFAIWRAFENHSPNEQERERLSTGLAALSRHPDDQLGRVDFRQGALAAFGLDGDVSANGGIDLVASPRESLVNLAADPDALSATTGTFAALSATKDALDLATDRFGVRPVWWYRDQVKFAAATSLRVLKEMLGSDAPPDEDAIAAFAALGYWIGDASPWRGIKRLRGGERLSVAHDVILSRWTDWSHIAPQPLAYDECVDALAHAVRAAIGRRVQEDTAHAALSGGLDSRLVVAGLRQANVSVSTTCIGP
ncbi:MAG: hypothetical protein WA906_01575, partial [Pacificimonas sp.]